MRDKRKKSELTWVEFDTKNFTKGPEVILAKFENGQVANGNVFKNVKCLTSGDKRSSAQFKRKLVVAETERLQYAGANFGPYCTRYSSFCEYYVGVVNKKTSKMQLINCELYNFKPTISGSIFGIVPVEEKKPLDTPSYRQQRDELTMSFGSLKKQRVVESRIRHDVGEEDLEKVIHKAVEDVDVVSFPAEDTHDDPLKDIIPSINRSAQSVEDVYKVKDLIPEDELCVLDDVARVLANASPSEIKIWSLEEKYCKYIMECLKLLPINEEARVKKCKLLIYMQLLMSLFNLKVDDLKKNDPLPQDVPDLIRKKLLSTYLQKAARNSAKKIYKNISPKNKDKLIAHIIVLALLFNDFKFNCEMLLSDLKISMQKFNILVKAVGAKFQKATGRLNKARIVTLSLPLMVPELKINGGSKRKR